MIVTIFTKMYNETTPQLPLEMISYIAGFLDIIDIISLSGVNRDIHDMLTSDYRVVITTIRSYHISSNRFIRRSKNTPKYFHMPGRIIKTAMNMILSDRFVDLNKKVIDFYIKRLLSGITLRFQNKDFLYQLCAYMIGIFNMLDFAKTILDSGLLTGKQYRELLFRYRNQEKSTKEIEEEIDNFYYLEII